VGTDQRRQPGGLGCEARAAAASPATARVRCSLQLSVRVATDAPSDRTAKLRTASADAPHGAGRRRPLLRRWRRTRGAAVATVQSVAPCCRRTGQPSVVQAWGRTRQQSGWTRVGSQRAGCRAAGGTAGSHTQRGSAVPRSGMRCAAVHLCLPALSHGARLSAPLGAGAAQRQSRTTAGGSVLRGCACCLLHTAAPSLCSPAYDDWCGALRSDASWRDPRRTVVSGGPTEGSWYVRHNGPTVPAPSSPLTLRGRHRFSSFDFAHLAL
jgi:hypothetical protein